MNIATSVPALDLIKLEILSNALRSIADETFIALMRSAYSTNIKERRDHSTAFLDIKGRLIVQAAASLPIHIASMSGMIRHLRAQYGADIRSGDIFIANDPHAAGGTHLPDIGMALPVFIDDELIGFMCNIAHHADVGGSAPGSMAGGLSEIFQEGLRIPVIRLFAHGELNQDLFRMILLNVRMPDERRGDYFAQVASCRLGERRIQELCRKHGLAQVVASFDNIIARTEMRLRKAIRSLSDGVYRFEDFMDDDGLGTKDIPIRLSVTVKGEIILFDFAGTSPQVKGNINATRNATEAAVYYSLKALLDPEVPNNQGVLNVVNIRIPEGSVLDAVFPAPVAGRAHTCQRVVDVVIGALAEALPQEVVGAANGANTTAVFAGKDPRTLRDYVYIETLGGGFGGRASHDGTDGVQVHITNTSNLPVEAIEMEFPLEVEAYELIPDSGGAGRYRGGLGLRRIIRPVGHDCTFNGAGERFLRRPWGIFDAGDGASGQFLKIDARGEATKLPGKVNDVTVRAGESIVVETPGAGGYGRAAERSREALAHDLLMGKFTPDFVRKNYPHYRMAE
ncbi:MAG: hydantoinase B/oxoprolinase family protein [Pseudorhodoplanes sp.]|uniref:hydantoinase B/oxoprolinase family protein n=1 Tax=Pseudorhodoplanes sp. TaxID=1934341 RepID=UPI003D0C15AD